MNRKISIIIRAKNEERWIVQCLQMIKKQVTDDHVEVVLVDNKSTDKTVEKAKAEYKNLILLELDEYIPGNAINEGVRASTGDYIVCLSAHCIPKDSNWLKSLCKSVDDNNVAGVYGRQEPFKYSSSADKRDLANIFGLDKRIQVKDTFFHNANSIIKREIWERFPFDETVSNIEDRVWGETVIAHGLHIVYEPEASVYHYHGINQNNNEERVENVVRILESINTISEFSYKDEYKIVAIIPMRHLGDIDINEELIKATVEDALDSELIDRVFVSTESRTIREIALRYGAEAPFLRDEQQASSEQRYNEVLKWTLETIESTDYYPDIVVSLEVYSPLRQKGIIDRVIQKLIDEGLDTVLTGYPSYRPTWHKEDGKIRRLDKHFLSRNEREPFHIGIPGVACASFADVIRCGLRYGEKVGIIESHSPLSMIEVRSLEDIKLLELREFIK